MLQEYKVKSHGGIVTESLCVVDVSLAVLTICRLVLMINNCGSDLLNVLC